MRLSLFFLAALVMGTWSSAHAAGLADHAVVDGDFLDGYDAKGVRVWRHFAKGPLQLETRRDRSFELNGKEVIGRDGRVVMRLSDHAHAGATLDLRTPFVTADETWSPAVELEPETPEFLGPAFDGAGNAYAAVLNGQGYTQVLKSDGVSGTWAPLGAAFVDGFYSGTLTVDPQGNVTMACYCSDDESLLQVRVARYEPATGWTEETIYSGAIIGSIPARNMYVASDASGDAILATDVPEYEAASFFYSNTTKTWSGATQIPLPLPVTPGGLNVAMPALSRSPDGTHIQFSYVSTTNWLTAQPALGIYTDAFDPATGTFGSPVLVPKTTGTVVYADDHLYAIPAFVDNTGAFTTIWSYQKNARSEATNVSRYAKGRWKTSKLTDEFLVLLDDSYGWAIDPAGDIVIVTEWPVPNTSNEEQEAQVFKYKAGSSMSGSGWTSTIAATWAGDTGCRQRVAWLGTAGNIVVSFMPVPIYAYQYSALSSTIWNGSTWSTPVPVPPDNQTVFFQQMATDTSGNVALIYNPTAPDGNGGGTVVSNTFATFMTP